MASSLININEATNAELQQLKGIGPKRADHIEQFRSSISPIRNTLDLCAATGISKKSAEQLSENIDWQSRDPMTINSGPAWVTLVICVSLIYIGFDQITREPFVAPASIYHLSLALILSGGLAAAGDVVMAGVRRIPTESTWIFPMAVLMMISGFTIIAGMCLSALFLNYPESLVTTLSNSLTLLIFAAIMVWLLYGPALTARFSLDDPLELDRWSLIYDLGLPSLLLGNTLIICFLNGPTWMEEIFSGWCIVISAIGAAELKQGRSAYFQSLPLADQSRVRYAFGRLNGRVSTLRTLNPDDPNKHKIARLIMFAGLTLSAVLVGRILLPG